MNPTDNTVIHYPLPNNTHLDTLFASALRLHQSGDLQMAQELYKQVLEAQPEHLDALYLSGVLATQQQRYGDAYPLLAAARKLNPNIAAVHTALGNLQREQGETEAALASYASALALDAANADAYYNRGILHHEREAWEAALNDYKQAVACDEKHVDAWTNLGVILKTLGHLEEAIRCYNQALRLNPHQISALFNLGVLYDSLEQFDLSIDFYRRCLLLDDSHTMAAFNMGIALRHVGELEESLIYFQHILQREPHHTGALQNLGASFQELGRNQEADECYARALQLDPDVAEVRYNRSLLTLARGDYAKGWEEYEARWVGAFSARKHLRQFQQPQWRGEDISGQTILLYAEQGQGDTLQFIRYVPMVKARGARVIVDCQPSLVRLLRTMPGIDDIFSKGEVTPDHPPFDVQCALLSLPRAFGTTLKTVPADIPYLHADPAMVEQWRALLPQDKTLKVGLVWAGNPRRFSLQLNLIDQRRSLHLAQLAPLAQCEGVTFISLQVGEGAAELKQAPAGLNVLDLTDRITDFADTAALIENLDLVISVDTSVAHLAGALGKKVWLLSRHDACWRWMTEREDSPWYPTLRLLRQATPGDWQPVIDRVVTELHALTANR
ncbi:MAG: tetratricopeptide repeat protein [Burkholderiaceae bacterium]|nr:MAG: tetratricopeptide repeat protein [Burkholderiaceae bacterium]